MNEPDRQSSETSRAIAQSRYRRGKLVVGLLITLISLSFAGCGHTPGLSGLFNSRGSVRTVSLSDEPVALASSFDHQVYEVESRGDTSFFLSDIPVEALLRGDVTSGQVLHIELLWIPKPGSTPMDETATNISIRHIIISKGEVGVYGGAGFAIPSKRPGRGSCGLEIRDATLSLLDSTPGFTDPLSPARMSGSFTAKLDGLQARKYHRAISQFVTNALGVQRFVLFHPPTSGTDRLPGQRVSGS